MVTILRPSEQTTTKEKIGRALLGAGETLSTGLGDILKEREKKKKETDKIVSSLLPKFDKFTKTFVESIAGQFTPETKKQVYDTAKKLVETGVDPETAFGEAWNHYIKNAPQEKKEKTFFEKLITPKTKEEAMASLKELGENIYGGTSKFAGGFANLAQFPINIYQTTGSLLRKGVGKLSGLSNEEIAQKESEFPSVNIPKALANLTGGRSIPQTGAQRILQGAAGGPEMLIASAAEEAAANLGLPEWAQTLVGVSALILGGRGQIPSKIESAAKNFVTRAERIATKTGKPVEAILKEAEVAGAVDLEKVNAGDGREIKKLDRSLNDIEKKTSEAFKEGKKFAREEGEKIRKETAIKLTESPLAKYYEPTIKEPKTAEGKASKELREAPVKARRNAILTEMKQPDFVGKSAMEREAKLSELREAEFELKWGRKPATQSEIMEQIEKQHAQMREYITNPDAEKIAKIRKQIVKDEEGIKTAQKLVDRGELPGARVVDEFIKIHEQYLKAYDSLVNELGEFVRKNQPIKGREQQVTRAKELIDLTNNMKKTGQAKLVNQIDKRKSLGALEKPSGAFYKNILKDVRGDVEQFQKQFFKVNRVLSPESMKTRKVAQKTLKEKFTIKQTESIAKTAENTLKNPTAENVEKLAKEADIPEETLGETMDRLNKAKEKVSKNPTEKTAENVSKETHLAKEKTWKKKALIGFAIGAGANIFEEVTGEALPSSTIPILGSIYGFTGGSFSYLFNGIIKNMFNHYHASKLKSLRKTPQEFSKYIQYLNGKYSKQRVNKVVKIMRENQSQ